MNEPARLSNSESLYPGKLRVRSLGDAGGSTTVEVRGKDNTWHPVAASHVTVEIDPNALGGGKVVATIRADDVEVDVEAAPA